LKNKGAFDWISVLANLGVVAGLVLVAYEVRQATLQAEAEASHAFATETQVARKDIALSPDLADVYVKATTKGVDVLTPVERYRLTEGERARKTRMLGQIRQYELGFVHRGAIEAMLPTLSSLEKGLWPDLEIGPVSGRLAQVIEPLREEMELRDQ